MLTPHSKTGHGFGFLCVSALVLCRYSDFLPLFRNIHARPIGNCKLAKGVSVNSCLSFYVALL